MTNAILCTVLNVQCSKYYTFAVLVESTVVLASSGRYHN